MAEGTSIGQLIVEIGSEVIGGSQLKDFITTLAEGSMTAYAQVGAIEQLAVKMRELADVVMQAASTYEMFESTTGLSAMQLQQWQGMAAQANISVQTMTGSVQSLGEHLANIRWTGQGLGPFMRMNIAPGGDPFTVLKKMVEWSRHQPDKFFAGNTFEQAGVSRNLLQLGRLSDSELSNFITHASVMTSAQQNTFNRLTLALTQMHQALMKMGYALMEYVLPPATHMVNMFNVFLDQIGRIKTELLTLGATLAIAFVAANPELALMVAAFGALYLILDDIAVYMQGGHSLMGEFMKFMERLPHGMAGLKAFFETLKLWLDALMDPVHLMVELFEKLESIGSKGHWLNRFVSAVEDAKVVFQNIPTTGLGINKPFVPATTNNYFDTDVNVATAGVLDSSGTYHISRSTQAAVVAASQQIRGHN